MRTNKSLVLAAMVFAVAMTFIDQTIVAIAIPSLQRELDLGQTASQWIINGYLLALTALFAFGGRLGDVLGRRRMVVVGVIGFAIASALCGFTPKGDIAGPWMIAFRVVQGAFAALMFPAAVAIVVASYPLQERGRAMAVFFGISGGLTAIGPIAGGFLTQWTWRSIFWINVPVALVALYLIHRSRPEDVRHPSPLDYRGTVLACAGLGLVVVGLQQASQWGWGGPATIACLVVGAGLCAAFVAWELRVPDPLLDLHIFRDRAFATDALVLALMSVVFVPFFFFGSVYAQVSLGLNASKAGLYILYFFLGFVVAAQIGGRILDRRGARPSVVIGSIVGAVGFYLLARRLPDLSLTRQWPEIALSGAGLGFILGPASTDAVNRAPASAYSEVTGITQTGRNLGASLGLAILGTVLIDRSTSTITGALARAGVPHAQAEQVAQSFGNASGAGAGAHGASPAQVHAVQLAFAHATQTVFYAMAAVLAANFVVARVGLPRGRRVRAEEEAPRLAAAG